jgi:YGGT family
MNERETERTANAGSTPTQREIYHETVVAPRSAPANDGAAREVYQERVSGPAGEQVVRSEHVSVPSDATRRGTNVTRIKQVVYFIFGAINVLLLIRFILLLLGANDTSPFVNLIYGMSRAFVMPFSGIFPEPTLGGSVFEWATLVGIVVYSLLGYGIARIVELVYAPVHPTVTPAS